MKKVLIKSSPPGRYHVLRPSELRAIRQIRKRLMAEERKLTALAYPKRKRGVVRVIWENRAYKVSDVCGTLWNALREAR